MTIKAKDITKFTFFSICSALLGAIVIFGSGAVIAPAHAQVQEERLL